MDSEEAIEREVERRLKERLAQEERNEVSPASRRPPTHFATRPNMVIQRMFLDSSSQPMNLNRKKNKVTAASVKKKKTSMNDTENDPAVKKKEKKRQPRSPADRKNFLPQRLSFRKN